LNSKSGKSPSLGKTYSQSIPPQITNQNLQKQLRNAGQVIEQSVNALIVANIAVNIFMAASLQYLWSLMNVIQLIVHEPLLAVQFPAEVRLFLDLLLRIVKFKIIPTDKILGTILDFK